MSSNVPFLARIGERAAECPPCPKLSVGTNGLLRREDAMQPFVDELLAAPSSGDAPIFTIMTKAEGDPPDPDAVRRDLELSDLGIDTLVTRAQTEPNDPDVVRNGVLWAMATSYTSGGRDKPDPDWIRQN